MKTAFQEAQKAFKAGMVPVGAIIVLNGKVISKAYNEKAPFAHAEYLAIKKAYDHIGEDIRRAVLYVTLEPCNMCASMVRLCEIQKVVFGAYDTKDGGVDHGIKVKIPNVIGGILEEECGAILKQYFQKKRTRGKNENSNLEC